VLVIVPEIYNKYNDVAAPLVEAQISLWFGC